MSHPFNDDHAAELIKRRFRYAYFIQFLKESSCIHALLKTLNVKRNIRLEMPRRACKV